MVFDIKNVSFYYDDKKVINDISIVLTSGKFYGIIGPNGCGKTTFLDILSRHIHPTTGNVAYKGKNLADYSAKQLSKEIALVPQDFYINFPFTAKEIVMMGRYPHIHRFSVPSAQDWEIVDNIMEKTETSKFKDRFITQLSGGEKQRVVFARALAQDTSSLILDEATSNFDVNHSIKLLNIAALEVKEKGKTVIAALQDINLAALFCDYLIFMKQGSIVADGACNEVLNEKTIYSVFDVKAKVYFETYSNSTQAVFKK